MSNFDENNNKFRNENNKEESDHNPNSQNNGGLKNSSSQPGPRSRFNFSNNRLTPVEPVSPPTPERIKEKQPSTRRSNAPAVNIRQVFGRGKELVQQERSPLAFNVAQLMRDVEGSTRDYDVEADELKLNPEPDDFQYARNIKGHIRFTKVLNEILAQGKFEAEVNMECVRCLEQFTSPIEIELVEQYEPSVDVGTGLPVRLEEEEEEEKLKIDPNHVLNLSEALRQQFLVSLPMHPLCSEDCPGLYAYVDKANEDVPFVEEEEDTQEDLVVDKRWAALSQLLKDDK